MKILIAEDDIHTRQGLADIFENEGYQVITADNGMSALTLYHQESPEVICLDIMMPEMNGYDVCKKIRELNPQVPILFISAKSEEIDKVLGLELGADDFIVKPFGVKEVIARIRAVTRRYIASQQNQKHAFFQMGDLIIHPDELRIYREERCIEVSLRDIKILQLFYQNIGKILSRDEIFDACWGMDHMPNSRTLDQHISQLRKRIEIDPKNPKIIQTIRGVGYRYEIN
ncbi:MAG: two-component system alkaline phosphatase synthesis response regulator PhoP [bacterium]|jgi:two-component system alkaline phosphatase synthesis response regulator PhoP